MESPEISKALANTLEKENWSIAHIEACAQYIATGDISKVAEMFNAPKELVLNWVRAQVVKTGLETSSDKVKIECWKSLLNDLKGLDAEGNIKVEIIIGS